jgi:hypothetical protein
MTLKRKAWLVTFRCVVSDKESTMVALGDDIAEAMTEAYRIQGEDAIEVVAVKRHGVKTV